MGRYGVGITRLLPVRFGREVIYTYCSLHTVTSGSEDKHTAQGWVLWVLNIWFWTGVEWI